MNSACRFLVLLVTAAALAAADGPAAPVAPGGTAPAGASGGGLGGVLSLPVMMILVFGIMYFLMIRPQKKEEAKRKELIAGLKRGDKVTTIGGAQGVVVAVGENHVDLDVGADGHEVFIRFTKGAVNASAVQPALEAVKAG